MERSDADRKEAARETNFDAQNESGRMSNFSSRMSSAREKPGVSRSALSVVASFLPTPLRKCLYVWGGFVGSKFVKISARMTAGLGSNLIQCASRGLCVCEYFMLIGNFTAIAVCV